LAKIALAHETQVLQQIDTEISQKADGWMELVELHLGMFIAQQVVCSSLLESNVSNNLTRQWIIGQTKLS